MSRLFSSIFSMKLMAGNRRLFLLCLLLFLASSLLSFGWFFPAEVVQRSLIQRVSQQAGLKMQGSHSSMLFPLGLKLDLYVESQVEQINNIRLEGLEITPSWSSLFSGKPAAAFESRLSLGTVQALAGQGGSVEVDLSQVSLLPLQQPNNDYLLAGRISGRLVTDNAAAGVAGKGAFNLELLDGTVTGLQRLGLPASFKLGRVQLVGKFNQNRVSIERIIAAEGMIELSGGGTLLVGQSPDKTRLNLNVRLHPVQSTPESVRELISLSGVRPTTDGSYLLRIGGTLAKPFVR